MGSSPTRAITRTARLRGTRRNPIIEVRFGRHAQVPSGVRLPAYPPRPRRRGRPAHTGRPTTIQDWVYALPGRRWNPDGDAWWITNPGPDADRVLADLGFTVDFTAGHRAGVTCCADLADPVVEVDPDDAWTVRVWPRFCDAVMPAGAVWDHTHDCWLVHAPDLYDDERWPWLPADVVEHAETLYSSRRTGVLDVDRDGVDGRWPTIFAALPRGPRRLPAGVPAVPSWYGRAGEATLPTGFAPFGYQVAGAYAVATGHTLLADLPGIGKTQTSLLAHALAGTRRLVVTCPPIAVTNWVHEIADLAGYANRPIPPPTAKAAKTPGFDRAVWDGAHQSEPDRAEYTVVTVTARRKTPDLPDAGVVVVSDSLLAA